MRGQIITGISLGLAYKFRHVIDGMIMSVLTPMEGALGAKLRYEFYKRKLKKSCGFFDSCAGFVIINPQFVSIGKNTSFNRNVIINADDTGAIAIGDNVIIGFNTFLRSSQHVYSDTTKPIREQGHYPADIVIGDDVWIGGNCSILGGASIGSHCIIGANSLVKDSIKEWVVAVGCPARSVKTRRKHEG